MGDLREVERLQAGLRERVLRSVHSGHHELRDIPPRAVLPWLCAAAFGPALGDDVELTGAADTSRNGVLAAVGADVLADVLGNAARAAVGENHPKSLKQRLAQEISRSIGEVLDASGERADGLRSDIAMVMREIDAGGTVFRAAVEAGSAAAEREALTAVEAVSAEFGDMAFMLADLRQAAAEVQAKLPPDGQEQPGSGWAGGCPYRGLLAYDQAHEAVFFGRERLTAELAGRLAETGIVMVSGSSGAGKTSLLQAGLIPALARGVQVPGSSAWPWINMTPTARPLTELASRLAALGGGDTAAIRQLLVEAPGKAHLLIGEIVLATGGPRQADSGPAGGLMPAGPLVLIIDQFEQLFDESDEDARLERAAFVDAVCAAATRPAVPEGEPPARVVIAVRGDYWDQCAAYPQLVPVMDHHQLVVGPLPPTPLRRAIAEPAAVSGLRIDSALVDAIAADAAAASGSARAGFLPRLSVAMLATWEQRENDQLTAAGYERSGRIARAVEVSAEAVYGQLPEDSKTIARDIFRQLTSRGQDRQPVRRPLTLAELRAGRPKRQWDQVGAVLDAFARNQLLTLGPDGAEITHDVLFQAWPRLREWLEQDHASVILHDVLRASERAAARGRWRRRSLAAAVAVLLVAVLAGAGLAVRSARNSADRQQITDISGRLAAQSTALDPLNPLMASLLAGAAWRVSATAQARYSLLESLAQPVRGILSAQSGAVTALAYSPGGKTLAVGYSGGSIRLWDLTSQHMIGTTTFGATVLTLAFTGSGKVLEVADSGAVGTWNLTTGAKIAVRPLSGGSGAAAALSSDGKTLATGDNDGNVRLWNTATGQQTGQPMSSDLAPVDAVAFSPDGKTLAAASSDGTVQLWDAATQQEAGPAIAASSAEVKTMTFGPGGKLLATGDVDGNVRLWDVASQSQVGATMAAGGPLAALTFSASGATLATADDGGSTRLWDVTTQRQTGAPLTASGSGGVAAASFSPGADQLATGNGDGTVRLWDPAGFHQVSAPLAIGTLASPTAVSGSAPAVLSADGNVLAVTGGNGTVRLWDMTTRRPQGAPISDGRTVAGLAVSPDGALLATIGSDGKARLWDVTTQHETGDPMTVGGPGGETLAFSPDDKTLATAGANGVVRLWDVASQRQVGDAMTAGSQSTGPGPTAVAFSSGGTMLAAAGANGVIRFWDVATRQEIGTPMTAGTKPVYALAFNPSGSMMATADGDGTARLWDVATQQEIGAPMTAGTQPVYAVAFNSAGTMLATADGDGTARLWDVRFPAGLLTAACAIAGQSLTRQQWADYAGPQPFQQVCPAS